jgi:hypothetical protein
LAVQIRRLADIYALRLSSTIRLNFRSSTDNRCPPAIQFAGPPPLLLLLHGDNIQ